VGQNRKKKIMHQTRLIHRIQEFENEFASMTCKYPGFAVVSWYEVF
jgi:hypothetical protein